MGRLLAIPIALLVLLTGAMVWSGLTREPRADFAFIDKGDIQTLDPNRISWMEDIRIGYALYEGLYTPDPKTLKPVPGTAGSIDISEDKTRYTFHIRPEARWSNGDPVRSGDFVFAWKRMLDQPGDYTYLLDYIRGAEEYRSAVAENKPSDFRSVGIEALDDKTLRVTLKHPVTFFPDLCAFPPFFPLNEKSMERFKKGIGPGGTPSYDNRFIRPPYLVTNGPYRLEKWEFKKRLILVASDYYWDRKNVKSRVVERVIIDDDKLGEFLRYETGVVDMLGDLDPIIAAELLARGEKDPKFRRPDLHVFPAFGTYFYSINCLPSFKDGRPNPFHDVRVRRAFALSIDKVPIVKTVTRMGERIADRYVPPGSIAGYRSPERGLSYDPDEARRLLAEAGYPQGRGFPFIHLTYNTGANHAEVAQVVRRQWLDNLGIAVELEPVEPSVFKQRLTNKEYEVARASWFGDYPDISTFTDKYLANSDNNDSAWVNERYDGICARAAVESDPAKRLAMLREAEQLLLDEAPIIPIYYYTNRYMFRGNVRGVTLDPRNMVMMKAVEVVRP